MDKMIETTLFGSKCRFPAIYLKDLLAKEAAVNACQGETDPEKLSKLGAKIRRLNRKIPPCVQFI